MSTFRERMEALIEAVQQEIDRSSPNPQEERDNMTTQEFKQWQGDKTNAETAEVLCCSLRLVEKMRQGVRPVSTRTGKMISKQTKGISEGRENKTTLARDVSRCAGQMSFKPGSKWCEHRQACQRFLAWSDWDKRAGLTYYREIRVMMGRDNCELFLKMEEGGKIK